MEQPRDIGSRKDLVLYRLEISKESLNDAKILLEAGSYKSANNRAFYSIFYAINSVHALNGIAYRRHKDAIANFNKEYVKTEIFPKEMGKKIAKAEVIRHASDYDDFYIATIEETTNQIETAETFIAMVENYCKEQLEIQ